MRSAVRFVFGLLLIYVVWYSYSEIKDIINIVETRQRTVAFLDTAEKGSIVPQGLNARVLWRNGEAVGLQVVGCEYQGYHKGWSAMVIVVRGRVYLISGWR